MSGSIADKKTITINYDQFIDLEAYKNGLSERQTDQEKEKYIEQIGEAFWLIAKRYKKAVKNNKIKQSINDINPDVPLIENEDLISVAEQHRYMGKFKSQIITEHDLTKIGIQSNVIQPCLNILKGIAAPVTDSTIFVSTNGIIGVKNDNKSKDISKEVIKETCDKACSLWPLPGKIISSGYGKRGDDFHYGIDINGDEGDTILASGDGIILDAGFHKEYGNYVIIGHGNGVTTLYAHLRDPAKITKEKISKGDVIGYVGHSGIKCTGNHLHFEIRVASWAKFYVIKNGPYKNGAINAKIIFRRNQQLPK